MPAEGPQGIARLLSGAVHHVLSRTLIEPERVLNYNTVRIWVVMTRLLILATVALCSGLNAPSAWAAQTPMSHSNYGSLPMGADSYAYWREQAKTPDRVMYVPDPAGQRAIVQRIDVRPGDNDVFGSSSKGERAEVTRASDMGGFVDGQTIVMSWSVFIDSGFASPPGDWNNFVQTHVAGSAAQSPWQLNLTGDDAKLRMRLYGGGQWSKVDQPVGSVAEWFSLGALSKNQWHDFVAEVRFGCTATGTARVWSDGKLLVEATNRAIGYCDDPGLYWKQGFYRAAYAKPTRLWFDDTYRWANVVDAFAHYNWITVPH